MKSRIFTIISFWIISLFGYTHEEYLRSESVRYGGLADFFIDATGFRMELYLPAYVLESLYGFHLKPEEIEGGPDPQNTTVCQLENQILKSLQFVSKNKILNLKIVERRVVLFSYLFLKIEIQPLDSKMDSFEFFYDTAGSYDKSDRLAVSVYQGRDKSGGARNIAYLYENRKKMTYRGGFLETRVSRENEPFRVDHFLLVLFLASGYGLLSLLQMMKGNRKYA